MIHTCDDATTTTSIGCFGGQVCKIRPATTAKQEEKAIFREKMQPVAGEGAALVLLMMMFLLSAVVLCGNITICS
jgi:hypothetical protein